jgi:aryl-alcohol dehydrogenase-like predicted oxidoreductase
VHNLKATLIGTAQWGQNYGRTNRTGRVPDETLGQLLELMKSRRLTRLDTAKSYGDAESRIGELEYDFKVQTKIPVKTRNADELTTDLLDSLKRLKVGSVDALLIHDWHDLSTREMSDASNFLEDVIDRELATRVGISVYEIGDVESGLRHIQNLDLVQCPANLLDQRLLTFEAQSLLNQVPLVQVRSVFLQGWLANRDSSLGSGHPALEQCVDTADSLGISCAQLSMSFIQAQSWIDEVVVAPTNAGELEQIWSFIEASESGETLGVDWASLASDDLDLLDPRRW